MPSLKQQILSAASAEAVDELLNTGKTYKFASDSTRRAWNISAKRRVSALKGEKAVAVPVATISGEVEEKAPKKRRGNKKKLNPAVK